MVDILTQAIQKLNLWTSESKTVDDSLQDIKDTTDVINTLNEIVDALIKEDNDKKALCDRLVQSNTAKVLVLLLDDDNGGNESAGLKEKVAEVVAELAKTDAGRKHCSHAELISSLLKLLSCTSADVTVQACRALGNICYDNDYGRSIVHEKGGEDRLLEFLQSADVMSQENEQLRTVATGFLLNLVNTYEITQDHVLERDILSLLCTYLSRFSEGEDACIHILMILNCLADSENGRKKIISKNICSVLVSLMETEEITSEVVEAILELIGNLADDDVVKYQLATTNLCQNLVKLLKTERDSQEDDSINVTKVGCDLIVLMLTGDDSMDYLYGNGEGLVYKEMTKWLSSTDDTMQTAAALGIGNFARKDEHCIRMVAEGITSKLLDLLKLHNTTDGDIRLQHAILSALRNLAIPGVNKGALIESGVVDTLLPMLSVETFPVVFKLLGTLRMLIDGQEEVACRLGLHTECVKRVVGWCNTEDHPGVKGEANRLQAWLIKNSKSTDVMKCIVDLGGLPYLVTMIASEHEVMQIEALIALSLMCARILDLIEEALVSHEMSSKLRTLLSQDSVSSEVKSNVLTLTKIAMKSDKLKEAFQKADMLATVRQVASEEKHRELSEAAKAVEQLFESG